MNQTTRRRFLQGSALSLGLSSAVAPALSVYSDGDARIAELAITFWRLADEQMRFIDEAERIGGVLAYELNDDFRVIYEQLVAREEYVLAALASVSPNSLAGLITKLRVACVCEHLTKAAEGSLIEEVFFPALSDLEAICAKQIAAPSR